MALAITAVLAMLGGPIAAQVPAPAAPVPPPTISWLSRSSGPAAGGETITISGSDLTGTTAVRFGATNVSFVVNGDNFVDVVVPPSPSTPNPTVPVDVFLDTPSGTASGLRYTYWTRPTIVSAAPTLSSKDGGQRIVVKIANLGEMGGSRIDGGDVYSYNLDQSTEPTTLTVTTLSHAVGDGALVIVGSGGETAPVTITYVDTPVPVVTALMPSQGPVSGGTTVVVSGSHFTGATRVAFGWDEFPATSFTVNSDTQITLVTPALAEFNTQPLVVTSPVGLSAAFGPTFDFQGPPVIQGRAPSSGPTAGGTHVYLYGRDFNRATRVLFGGVPAVSVDLIDDWDLVAIAPPHAAGQVELRLDSALGLSTAMPFEYTDAGPPTINSITPAHGPVVGGNIVVIDGSGFSSATSVRFDGVAATAFTIDSDTRITATVPPGPYDISVDVMVTNAHGDSELVETDRYVYDTPPFVYGLRPSAGPTTGGSTIQIDAAGAALVTSVRFGGTAATFTYDIASGIIVATLPPHAGGNVAVVLEGPNGVSQATLDPENTFTYALPGVPVVTSMYPNLGPAVGGTVVYVTGIEIDKVTGARFGSTPVASFQPSGGDTLTLTAPPHAPGPVTVTLQSAAGDSADVPAAQFNYTVQPPPSAFLMSPNDGTTAGGSIVTFFGNGFSNATSVTFGGVPATFTVENDGLLTATTPPSNVVVDTAVPVVITTPLGSNTPDAVTTYTYRTPRPPTINFTSPNQGPIGGGTGVFLGGSGFTGATSVRFGSYEASFTVANDQRIDAVAPAVADPYLYDITVTTAGGSNPSAQSSWYLYRSQPAVWSVEASSGPVSGGNRVTIKGDQFLDATAVNFGWNAALSYSVIDQHTIVATVPACAAGTVWVTVVTREGTNAITFGSLYTFRTPGTPIVTKTDANRGSIAGGQSVVITGTGFTGATGVRFESTAATSYTVVSDTQITAVVPPRLTPALINISIDTPNGPNPNAPASWFLYTSP